MFFSVSFCTPYFKRVRPGAEKKNGALSDSCLLRGTAKSLRGNVNGECAAWMTHVTHHSYFTSTFKKLAVSQEATIRLVAYVSRASDAFPRVLLPAVLHAAASQRFCRWVCFVVAARRGRRALPLRSRGTRDPTKQIRWPMASARCRTRRCQRTLRSFSRFDSRSAVVSVVQPLSGAAPSA